MTPSRSILAAIIVTLAVAASLVGISQYKQAEARRLADRLDIHYTPKHGSWLNIAEIEFSVMQSQCLNRRIPNLATMRAEVAAWEVARNNRGAPINWQFTNEKARIKLTRLYPNL